MGDEPKEGEARLQNSQAPPSYGSGRYGFFLVRVQDSSLRDRCSVGTRHAFFSIAFRTRSTTTKGQKSANFGVPSPLDFGSLLRGIFSFFSWVFKVT